MSPQFAVAYGRSELLSVYRGNWFRGLFFAIALFVLILGAYYAAGYMVGASPPQVMVRVIPRGPIDFVPPSFFPRNTPPAPPGTAKPRFGSPVPVPDAQVSPDATIPAQNEFPSAPPLPGTADGTSPFIDMTPDLANDGPPADFVPVEKQPIVVREIIPDYPDLAVRAGIEGTVWVKIWVDTEGKVRQATVLKSSGDIFNEAALAAARQFLFTPAYMNNGPVAVWVSVPFRFRLAK